MGKFFISCDEATTICDKNQYGNASFLDKFKLTLHLLKCKLCKCYSNQNVVMTKVYKEYAKHECSKEKCLCNEDKAKMEEALKEQMKQ